MHTKKKYTLLPRRCKILHAPPRTVSDAAFSWNQILLPRPGEIVSSECKLLVSGRTGWKVEKKKRKRKRERENAAKPSELCRLFHCSSPVGRIRSQHERDIMLILSSFRNQPLGRPAFAVGVSVHVHVSYRLRTFLLSAGIYADPLADRLADPFGVEESGGCRAFTHSFYEFIA